MTKIRKYLNNQFIKILTTKFFKDFFANYEKNKISLHVNWRECKYVKQR